MRLLKWLAGATVLLVAVSCDKAVESKDAQDAMIESTVSSFYTDLGQTADDAVFADVKSKVGALPKTIDLDAAFRCDYETMVVADWARRSAGKPSFPDGTRITDDDLTKKAIPGGVLLSDAPLPSDMTPAFLRAHVKLYNLPPDGDALLAAAVWRAAFTRVAIAQFGVSGLMSPEADAWLTKGRSKDNADRNFRHRANLGIGEAKCFALIGKPLMPQTAAHYDADALAELLKPMAR